MINWQKQMKIFEIILSIQNFQVTPYYFKKIEDIYTNLLQLQTVIEIIIGRTLPQAIQSTDSGSEKWLTNVLYDLSLLLKPSKTKQLIDNDDNDPETPRKIESI